MAVAAGLHEKGSGGRTGGAQGFGQALDTALRVVRCGLARLPGRLAWEPPLQFFLADLTKKGYINY